MRSINISNGECHPKRSTAAAGPALSISRIGPVVARRSGRDAPGPHCPVDDEAVDAIYALYARVAPKPEDWPILLTKIGQLLRHDYDLSTDVAGIKAPTVIVVGDADIVRTAQTVELFELPDGGKADGGWERSGMSNARLAITPSTPH